MLVIKPRIHGAGIFDIFSRVVNSALAKKVINSTVGKEVGKHLTKKNLVKAANSAIGKKIQATAVKEIANAAEKVANGTLKKVGISTQPGAIAKTSGKTINSFVNKLKFDTLSQPSEIEALNQVFAASTVPIQKGKKRKSSSTPGRRMKKRGKFGKGIVLE